MAPCGWVAMPAVPATAAYFYKSSLTNSLHQLDTSPGLCSNKTALTHYATQVFKDSSVRPTSIGLRFDEKGGDLLLSF